MRLDMSQQMRMLQQMKLAPRMIQSMEILQLPVMALEERIREEQAQNPMLELGSSVMEKPTTDIEAQFSGAEASQQEADRTSQEGPSEQEIEAFEQLVEEFNDTYVPSHLPSRGTGIELADKKHDAMQNMADRPPSLEDHLLEQLALCEADEAVLDCARFLIANLNRKGFLNGALDDIRAAYDKGRAGSAGEPAEPTSPAVAEQALGLVQGLDPVGVGARDLRECLLLQLRDPDQPIEHLDVLRAIISNHLDDIEHNRLPAIERKSGFSIELIARAIEELKHLDLNPGGKFTADSAQYVVPDVLVERVSEGGFAIRMNDENTPNVHINKQYLKMLREKKGSAEVLEYVKKKFAAARWLIDSIEQRRNTLEKVTRAIIEHQHDFLEKGPDHIAPLKMQQIADRVGVHVTTVSRAVDDKWVQTPRGIFPLRRFFGGGTVTADGTEVAWDTVKRKLTELIAAEDKQNPYSDEQIVEKLTEQGCELARRTVTKYRKMLNIPSSRQRKQHI